MGSNCLVVQIGFKCVFMGFVLIPCTKTSMGG